MSLYFAHITQQADSLAQSAVPLGQLQEPPPVSFTFEATGWHALAWVLLVLAIVAAALFYRNYKRNAYRRNALEELRKVSDGAHPFPHALVVLKSVAIQVFSREKVGALHGEEWCAFLEKTANGVSFLAFSNEIRALVYKDEVPSQEVQSAILSNAKMWVKSHAR
ncbi:DUF4381 domain-containing protein [Roseivirga pacifica]|uniref:DUF4381 domain-containing protein n=1 Tax=Roseivirga pacifica TaxID=1267423 RepID=UPI0020952BF3|nr:DUF4381 domain-containing protein [Roseivirga pacifica]MCO6358687.1 DUF4381 family protein [Roseivirga pacifica]MCO6365677.1 DUF4381 family protein [Roseivirga pacifica]MCO6371593.1 DUF4381 family protein [Roseivirga pacifica]MCO6376296.1 DUF4381 family protein [Roseivirga pacifica]MCO6378971.1 DUF4381 family protein [Roseivirga pacifica]